jgi:hypothetical protein
MGKKRSGGGNKLYLCVAILIFMLPSACATGRMGAKMVDTTGDEAAMHLALGRKFLAEGNYGLALTESEKVPALAGKNVPVAESLLYVGLIQAHPANPARDDGKAIIVLKRLIRDYPESPQADQAKAIVELIQENEKLSGKVERSGNQLEKLNSQIERLNNIINELKKVDIDVEQKKREKGR